MAEEGAVDHKKNGAVRGKMIRRFDFRLGSF